MNQQLELHSLSKKYKKSESCANDNINLRFNKGEITAIAGHNGAGKTTMLNQIIGITKSTKGSITFNGLSFARDSKIAREYVSMMPQLHAPLAGITMAQSVESIIRIRGGSQKIAEEECIKILKELKIDGWKDIPGQKLSGGLRRLT
ncbi:ATP-binding cassette domain-containing protein [Enterococcus faecalis]